MSAPARITLALILVLGAALFVAALAWPEPAGTPATPAPADGTAEVPAGPPAKPGLLDSSENCKECHEEIWKEWSEDRHSQAWVGALYTKQSLNHTDTSCFSCHAPRPILETGLDSPAEARQDFRESGINCLSCHQRSQHVVGSGAPGAAPCGPVHDPKFPTDRPDMREATINFCGVCHNLHGTHLEFMGSRYYRDGMTCLTCHMAEEVTSPAVTGGPTKPRKSHRFRGAHSPEMLRKAMTIVASQVKDKIVARVVNQGAGHKIPTDARHRAIRLKIAFLDPYGQPVPVLDPTTGNLEREALLDLIRLFYRQEQKEPTQIDPEGTLGKDNWRESSIAIPDAAKGGKAVLHLYYNLSPYEPVEQGTLVEEKVVPIEGGPH
ncbi:MAG TPA: multiheme c-type cytochrome [Planctomycetota bacterium]|nr:multiheme c-type cytochrome [Planctomycetota bacterium]